MANERVIYHEQNVLDAAKERIKYIIRHFDALVVSFSGGKDSMTVLNLCKQVYTELGRTDKVNVFFFDEEFVPPSTLRFIDTYRDDPQVNFIYACLQMESEVAYCGKINTVIQWGKERTEWMRPVPEYATTDWENVYDVYTVSNYLATRFKGKIANLTGVRAQESPTRRAMVMAHKNDYPFIHKGKSENVFTVTPIYDWSLLDVWKFIYDSNLDYNINYDEQMFSGKKELRVDTPLHAKGQKDLHLLKQIDPSFFAKICHLFPEFHAAALYNKDLMNSTNVDEVISKYEHSFRGMLQYVNDHVTDPVQQKQARYQISIAMRNRTNHAKKEKYQFSHPFYFYPLYHVFKEVVKKNFDKKITICPPSNYSRKHFEYEGLDYDGWRLSQKNNS